MSMIFILIKIPFDIDLNNNDELLIIIREHNKEGKLSSVVFNSVGYLGEKNWLHISDIILTSLFSIYSMITFLVAVLIAQAFREKKKKKTSIIALLHCTPRPCPYTLYRFRV
jgi:hypothetical protein